MAKFPRIETRAVRRLGIAPMRAPIHRGCRKTQLACNVEAEPGNQFAALSAFRAGDVPIMARETMM